MSTLDLLEKGRRIVIAITVGLIGVSIGTIVAYNSIVGSERIGQQLVRLFLTVVLCAMLIRGFSWARWISVILLGMGAASSINLADAIGVGRSLGWIMYGIGAVYAICAILLAFNPAVGAHFAAARSKPV